jgi:hypothetical protein
MFATHTSSRKAYRPRNNSNRPLLQIIKINVVSYFADSVSLSAVSPQKYALNFCRRPSFFYVTSISIT